jgi:hypothetical protein
VEGLDLKKGRGERMTIGKEAPAISKKILFKALKNDSLTLDEIFRQCALWTVEEIGKYRFEPIPEKPESVKEFEQIPRADRRQINGDYFKDNPEIMEYYEKVRLVKYANKAILDWLVSCSELVKTKEELKALSDKIDEVKPEQLP